jgi:NAD(P)-dependent dehydrogenase (short-subunit alcohol dehydrogenase family)
MAASLQSKVAVDTSGGEGIGLAAAKRLAADGAAGFITGRRQAVRDKAVAEIGGDVVAVQADVSKPADLDRLYESVRASKGKLDILLANAGVQAKEALGSITEEALDNQLAVNFKGTTIFTVQPALPPLSEGGSIIQLYSTAAVKGLSTRTVYSATKAAPELKGRCIRVNVPSTGPIETPAQMASLADENCCLGIQCERNRCGSVGACGPARGDGEIVAFLASDACIYINGADIQADGGFAQV